MKIDIRTNRETTITIMSIIILVGGLFLATFSKLNPEDVYLVLFGLWLGFFISSKIEDEQKKRRN